MQESQTGSNLYHFTCWLSHTSTSAISSQNYISFHQMSHNHRNQNPGPSDLYLCHGKLWQSPKVTEGMAVAVGSCWWLLLLVATCGIEGHAGDSASEARAAGHILLLHPTVSQKTTHGPNSTLGQDFSSPPCTSTMLLIFLSSPAHCPRTPPIHSPLSVQLLACGMEWITHVLMKAQILKSCLKEEDYSDHWDNSSTIDSQNKAVGRGKKPKHLSSKSTSPSPEAECMVWV